MGPENQFAGCAVPNLAESIMRDLLRQSKASSLPHQQRKTIHQRHPSRMVHMVAKLPSGDMSVLLRKSLELSQMYLIRCIQHFVVNAPLQLQISRSRRYPLLHLSLRRLPVPFEEIPNFKLNTFYSQSWLCPSKSYQNGSLN